MDKTPAIAGDYNIIYERRSMTIKTFTSFEHEKANAEAEAWLAELSPFRAMKARISTAVARSEFSCVYFITVMA